MGQIKPNLMYTREHEWVLPLSPGLVRVGITDFAQKALGDIVFLELPPVGESLRAEAAMGSAESIKSVSDVYSPVNGRVTAVNSMVEENPGVLNTDPYGEGWLIEMEVEPQALERLMSPDEYAVYTSEEAEEAEEV